ncbi:MFS transporter [Micromonospora sp. NPDC048830]|uniref:MFS transporter n=1 Tax=Micromonospora sp. NPDC048830 TaxID=3364257 RepID=UPI00371C64CD
MTWSGPWATFSATALGLTICGLNATMVDVALPRMAGDLQVGQLTATWFVLAYWLATCALLLPFGRVADVVGRRPVFLAGVACLTAGAAICAYAPSAAVVILARTVQGVGAAMVLANTTAILVEVFPASRTGTALGLNVATISAAQVAGPLVGGAFTTFAGWRSIFFVTLVIGVVALALSAQVLARTGPAGTLVRFSYGGALMWTAALVALFGGFTLASSRSWGDPLVLAVTAAAAMSLLGLVKLQRSARHPLIDPTILRDRRQVLRLAGTWLIAMPRAGLALVVSVTLQVAHGVDPFEAGRVVFGLALGLMVASLLAGALADRFSARRLCAVAAAVVMLGLVVALAAGTRAGTPLMLGLFLVGAGSALYMTPNTIAIMTCVRREARGAANGLRSTLQAGGRWYRPQSSSASSSQGSPRTGSGQSSPVAPMRRCGRRFWAGTSSPSPRSWFPACSRWPLRSWFLDGRDPIGYRRPGGGCRGDGAAVDRFVVPAGRLNRMVHSAAVISGKAVFGRCQAVPYSSQQYQTPAIKY